MWNLKSSGSTVIYTVQYMNCHEKCVQNVDSNKCICPYTIVNYAVFGLLNSELF